MTEEIVKTASMKLCCMWLSSMLIKVVRGVVESGSSIKHWSVAGGIPGPITESPPVILILY